MNSDAKVGLTIVTMIFILLYTILIFDISKCDCADKCVEIAASYKAMEANT